MYKVFFSAPGYLGLRSACACALSCFHCGVIYGDKKCNGLPFFVVFNVAGKKYDS
jgi:hypothetical protein